MRIFALFLAIVLLAGCANPVSDHRVTFSKPGSGEVKAISRESLVGTWYGNQLTQNGTTKEWISRRLADGKFQAHFLEKKDGRVIDESIEVGEWGLSYDLEIVVTRGWLVGGRFRPAPADAYFWDVYRIESVDAERMTYEHEGTGHRYQVRRVPDEFDFPAGAPPAEVGGRGSS